MRSFAYRPIIVLAVSAISTVQPVAVGQTVPAAAAPERPAAADGRVHVKHATVSVNGVDIFYREAGPKDAPTILLLHGFPSSSSMFRNLIPALADRFHLVAPDYPGFGRSAQPTPDVYAYTFDNISSTIDAFTQQLALTKYAIYVQDYGAPVGYRLAVKHPERITGIIVQNGNAYDEGLPDSFWAPLKEFWKNPTPELRAKLEGFLGIETTKWQYLHGARDPRNISPDAWTVDQSVLDRPGNKEIQIALFKDYGSNPPLYPSWQEYFRTKQPPMLIVWGKNDQIFPPTGAEPYKRDLMNIDFNLLDTGHFALEEDGDLIAQKIRAFMDKNVPRRIAITPAPAGGWGQYIFNQSEGFTDQGFYRAFTKSVPIRTMVVNCIDPRCVKVPELVADTLPGEIYPGTLVTDAEGRKVGSTATVMPMTNAGGRAVDALRTLAIGEHLWGLKNIAIVHHTHCGTTSFTADGFVSIYNKEHNADISTAIRPRDLAIVDFNKSLRDDVALLRASPAVPKGVNIYGYVYDINLEKLTLVVEDKAK